MVVAEPEPTDDTEWRVDAKFSKATPAGEPVANGGGVRLLHCATRRRLHSHQKQAYTIPFDGHEVTAFSDDAGGNNGDDWRVETLDGGPWVFGKPFRLLHPVTSRKLHSDLTTTHPTFSDGLQGVMGVEADTPGTLWVAEDPEAELGEVSMRLREVRIRGFRSIRGEVRLLVDARVTVLIGANDHGKTNLLEALLRLNDENPFTEEDRNWDERHSKKTPHVEWDFDCFWAAGKKAESVTFSRSGVGGELEVKEAAAAKPSARRREILLKSRPRVELFSINHQIRDCVTREELDAPEHEFMKGLFIKAGLWEDRNEVFSENTWSRRRLDDASARLTQILQQEWDQGRSLGWRFRHMSGGSSICLDIQDPAVSTQYVKPSQRSAGFTAFFVLSLTAYARTCESKARSSIYLFDEPGTNLHPVAQVDLQRVFEAMADTQQIVYTTHSIFLVSKNVPGRNRVISKTERGTIVDAKPFARNWKAVRESLGILLAQNFLVSDRTLLVEGPSDPVYLMACLGKLVQAGLIDLDLNEFSVMDGGDERNYIAMAKILLEEAHVVLALLDGDGHGDKTKERLLKAAAHQRERLHVHQLPPAHSIEDLLLHGAVYPQAVGSAMRKLASDGVVEYAGGLAEDKAITELEQQLRAKPKGKTLGKHTEDVTRALCGEPISKLCVAFSYEDALRTNDIDKPTSPLAELIEVLKTQLRLRPRKAIRELSANER